MPRFNKTGPMGLGPRTGGGQGLCQRGVGPSAGAVGYPGIGLGRGGIPQGGGKGRCWGGGRRRRDRQQMDYRGYPFQSEVELPSQSGTSVTETELLKSQASLLEQQLQEIHDRLANLEKEAAHEDKK